MTKRISINDYVKLVSNFYLEGLAFWKNQVGQIIAYSGDDHAWLVFGNDLTAYLIHVDNFVADK